MDTFQQLDLTKKYTYTDYLTWKFEERVELLKGRVVQMSPAPNTKHQRIVNDVLFEINLHLRKKICSVFPAPFDVRLPVAKKDGQITTVVQPDIVVVCDKTKLDKQGCNGAPDIVMEVLSPGNTKKEMKDKLEIYQGAGIPEYWLIDPDREYILVYSLTEDGKYISSLPYVAGDKINSQALKGFSLRVQELFEG